MMMKFGLNCLSIKIDCKNIEFKIQKKYYRVVNNKIIMGGNAFEDTEPLTPTQYEQIVKQIVAILMPFCERLEPYIPLPQKPIHGDVDFLLILKEGQTINNIREILSIDEDKFIKNNNMTANSVYQKKQVDFNLCKDNHEFELCRFYKSYGGIGAFLGLFLPSKFVKLNQDGLFCCAYRQHIKMEFLVSNCIEEIFVFYGIDPSCYYQGFKTRKELFEYLRKIRFLHEQSFIKLSPKHSTKLMKAFQDYLIVQTPKNDQQTEKFQDPIRQTLKYFKKNDEFEQQWIKKLQQQKIKKELQNKWNGMHIMKIFNINSKMVNSFKLKFEKNFKDRKEYQQYIEKASFQEIVLLFSKTCDLQVTP